MGIFPSPWASCECLKHVRHRCDRFPVMPEGEMERDSLALGKAVYLSCTYLGSSLHSQVALETTRQHGRGVTAPPDTGSHWVGCVDLDV